MYTIKSICQQKNKLNPESRSFPVCNRDFQARRILTTRGKAIKVPIAEPMEAKTVTRRTLVRRFFHQPLKVEASSVTFSISLTLGRTRSICTRPVTIPAPIMGLRLVIGAAIKPAGMVRGWPNARIQPTAVKTPLMRIQ